MKRLAFGRIAPGSSYLARARRLDYLDLEVVALSAGAAKLFVSNVLGLDGRAESVEDVGPPARPERYREGARTWRVRMRTVARGSVTPCR